MKYRKIHINNETWIYHIGKRFIDIRNPNGKRTQVKKEEIFMDNPETAKERKEGDLEWAKYSWDKYVCWGDFDIKCVSRYTPSIIKKYIEVKFYNET